ncbi:MAG: FAD-binding oxidoreductase [Candidatus Woesearchaeota archaeon]
MKIVRCRITDIKDETYDVKTFRGVLSEGIEFVAGQYFLLRMPQVSVFETEWRPFTFSSSPTEKRFIEFTVKRMGEFTTALHSLPKGSIVEIDGPRGEALNFNESVKDDVVFIAGGSGITPFISTIRFSVAKNLNNRITLIFSNRTYEDIIYKDELYALNSNGRIKVVHTLTDSWPVGWDGETGRINKHMIEKAVPRMQKNIWYVCGPPPMISAVEAILHELGIERDKIKIEEWQLPGKH